MPKIPSSEKMTVRTRTRFPSSHLKRRPTALPTPKYIGQKQKPREIVCAARALYLSHGSEAASGSDGTQGVHVRPVHIEMEVSYRFRFDAESGLAQQRACREGDIGEVLRVCELTLPKHNLRPLSETENRAHLRPLSETENMLGWTTNSIMNRMLGASQP